MFKSAQDANIFFFDCETSGLNPVRHEMLEVACIVTDKTGERILSEYETKIFPTMAVDEEAAKINGYSAEKWANEAVSLDTAMRELLIRGSGCVFAAHNAIFDFSFVEYAMTKRAQSWNGPRHKIDTVGLAWPLLKHGLVPNLKLTTLTEFFGIPHLNAHSAMADTRACRDVYLKLMKYIDVEGLKNHVKSE